MSIPLNELFSLYKYSQMAKFVDFVDLQGVLPSSRFLQVVQHSVTANFNILKHYAQKQTKKGIYADEKCIKKGTIPNSTLLDEMIVT